MPTSRSIAGNRSARKRSSPTSRNAWNSDSSRSTTTARPSKSRNSTSAAAAPPNSPNRPNQSHPQTARQMTDNCPHLASIRRGRRRRRRRRRALGGPPKESPRGHPSTHTHVRASPGACQGNRLPRRTHTSFSIILADSEMGGRTSIGRIDSTAGGPRSRQTKQSEKSENAAKPPFRTASEHGPGLSFSGPASPLGAGGPGKRQS